MVGGQIEADRVCSLINDRWPGRTGPNKSGRSDLSLSLSLSLSVLLFIPSIGAQTQGEIHSKEKVQGPREEKTQLEHRHSSPEIELVNASLSETFCRLNECATVPSIEIYSISRQVVSLFFTPSVSFY